MKKIYLVLLALVLVALLAPALATHKGGNPAPGEPAQSTVGVASLPSQSAETEVTESAGKPEDREQVVSSPQPRASTGAPSVTSPAQEGAGEPRNQQPQEKQQAPSGPETAQQEPPTPQRQAGVAGQAAEGSVTVGVAVVGKNREILYGPAEIELTAKNPWGFTALGALEATGLPYALSTRFPGLVENIAGQTNKGTSGWMYKVNEEVPMVPAGQKMLKPGDKVIWWYSSNIGSPAPRWEELGK